VSGPPATADVVVIGAGICGAACAGALAARGASAVVVEKEAGPAVEQSGRAQGAIRVQGRAAAELPLAVEALRIWREVAGEAEFEFRVGGNLYVCTTPDEVAMASRLVSETHASGLAEVQLLGPEEAREVLPAARGDLLAAMWSPGDAQCDPSSATRTFVERARRAGARFVYDTLALEVVERGGSVAGVTTSRGMVATRAVVVAGGVWTSYLAKTVGVSVPAMPLVVSECETRPVSTVIGPCLRAFRFGARQRPDGRVVLSAGMDTVVDHHLSWASVRHLRLWAPRLLHHRRAVRLGVDWETLAREIRQRAVASPRLIPSGRELPPNRPLVGRAREAIAEVIPALRGAAIARYWAGVIDLSPDGLPIIEAASGPAGLVLVTGLSGHGLALGPVIGEITADLALGRRPGLPIEPFRLDRFRGPTPIPEKMI
jgi:sarcosine oxidase subunit beta